MDTIIQSYMEETEDMLQKAEECIIRLEIEYSSADVNELFRIAHTIKGSSHMVGYEDIGNLMHRIEDMLDCARNGTILFDQRIVTLCFDGLDVVKKLLQGKTESNSPEIMEEHREKAFRITERIETFIRTNKKEKERTAVKQADEMGIVSALLNKEPKGRNKYFITFIIEEDAPMVSPVLMMILKTIEDIGTLVYASVTDQYFLDTANMNEIRTLDLILCTDVDEAELYTYFALFYVEKINVINLSRNIHELNDYCFNETDYSPYLIVFKVILKLYHVISNRLTEFDRNTEEGYSIKKMHREAIDSLSRIRNKRKLEPYIREFNELFHIMKKIFDRKIKSDEKVWVNSQGQITKIIDRLYNETKGKYIVRIIRSERDNFVHHLKNFLEMMNKASTFIILIDISKLNILHEYEIKDLIEIIKDLQDQGIEVAMLADGPGARRIINIFDSIKPVYDFRLFSSELEAILGIFQTEASFHRIIKRIKDLESDQ